MAITIRGKELGADFYDADFIEVYEAATIRLRDAQARAKANPEGSTADRMRALIGTVEDYFDEIFGEGTAEDLFEGAESNVRTHLLAVDELVAAAAEQGKDLNDIINRHVQRTEARAKSHAPAQPLKPWPPQHGKKRRR